MNTWATVTQVSPLRLKLDGDTAALIITPDTLISTSSLSVDDRVRVELSDNRVTVIGRSGGTPLSSAATAGIVKLATDAQAITGTDATLAVPPHALAAALSSTLATIPGANLLCNSRFRANQRVYASGTALGPGAFTVDRWRDARVTNLVTNPSFEAATTGVTNVGTATNSKSTTNHRSGANSMAIIATGNGDNYVVLNVPTTVGKTYSVSIYAYITATGTFWTAGRFMFVFDGAGSGIQVSDIDQTKLNQWQRVSVTYLASTTTATIRLYPYTNASSTTYIDDVLVTEGSILYDYFDGSTTDCSWSGTADASTSYNAPNVAASVTFTADPHGQAVTLPNNGRIQQLVERSNAASGTYVLSAVLTGTAAMRAYNSTTPTASRPAFSTTPVTYTLDGTADVIVEFTGGASGGSVDKAKFEAGTSATAYPSENVDDELRRCQRYYEIGTIKTYQPQVTGGFSLAVNYKVTKRAAALLSYSAPPTGGSGIPTNTEWSLPDSFDAFIGSGPQVAASWTADAELR